MKAEAAINNGQMPLSTDWERNILTFTVPDVSEIEHMWVYLYARDFTGTLWWDDVQLEKANKASDWSPALEDIEEDIAEVDGKFVNYSTTVQMNAAITAARDSITSTVSRTYATKTEVSSVSGKVTSLESWKQEASHKIVPNPFYCWELLCHLKICGNRGKRCERKRKIHCQCRDSRKSGKQ